jgi:hypothetical protein
MAIEWRILGIGSAEGANNKLGQKLTELNCGMKGE